MDETRLTAWHTASMLVDKLVEQHGLEQYAIGNPFNQTSKMTKVDQHIDHIIRVAEWLLAKGDNG